MNCVWGVKRYWSCGWLSIEADKDKTVFNVTKGKMRRSISNVLLLHTQYITLIFPPFIFPLVTALLNALILVVFAHLKLIMKCMHWAKQAINQSRCVSRWVPEQVSGAQRPDGSKLHIGFSREAEPSSLTPRLSLPTYVCASQPYYN